MTSTCPTCDPATTTPPAPIGNVSCSDTQIILTSSIIAVLATALVMVLSFAVVCKFRLHFKRKPDIAHPQELPPPREHGRVTESQSHMYTNPAYGQESEDQQVTADRQERAVSEAAPRGESSSEREEQERDQEDGTYIDITNIYTEVIDNQVRNLQLERNQAYSNM